MSDIFRIGNCVIVSINATQSLFHFITALFSENRGESAKEESNVSTCSIMYNFLAFSASELS